MSPVQDPKNQPTPIIAGQLMKVGCNLKIEEIKAKLLEMLDADAMGGFAITSNEEVDAGGPNFCLPFPLMAPSEDGAVAINPASILDMQLGYAQVLHQGVQHFDLLVRGMAGASFFQALVKSHSPIAIATIVPSSGAREELETYRYKPAEDLNVAGGTGTECRRIEIIKAFVDGSFNREIPVDSPIFTHLVNFAEGRIDALTTLRRLQLIPVQNSERLLTEFMQFEREVEVLDTRPDLGPIDRAKIFIEQTDRLTDAGKQLAAEISDALANGKEVDALIPSKENPQLDCFVKSDVWQLPATELKEILHNTASLRLSEGCSHTCQHCYFNPSGSVRIMPFDRVLEIVNMLEQPMSPNNSLCPYHDSEPLDYYDPLYNADLADVVELLLEKHQKQEIHITTRGGYPGDKIAKRALRKLNELGKKFGERLEIRVSIDLFDTRQDSAAYSVRIAEVLTLLKDNPVMIAACAAVDKIEETKKIAAAILGLTENKHCYFEFAKDEVVGVSGAERGRGDVKSRASINQLEGSWDYDVANCMYGYHLFPDGRVLLKERLALGGHEYKNHVFKPVGLRLWEAGTERPAVKPKRNPKVVGNQRGVVTEDGLFDSSTA